MLYLSMNEPITDRRIALLDKTFESWYDPEWFRGDSKDLCTFIMKEIGNNDHIEDGVPYSNYAKRVISPGRLSGGVKTIIMTFNNPDLVFPTGYLGDNCAHTLNEVSKQRDMHFTYAGSIFNVEPVTRIHLLDTDEDIIIENTLFDFMKRGLLDEADKGIQIRI